MSTGWQEAEPRAMSVAADRPIFRHSSRFIPRLSFSRLVFTCFIIAVVLHRRLHPFGIVSYVRRHFFLFLRAQPLVPVSRSIVRKQSQVAMSGDFLLSYKHFYQYNPRVERRTYSETRRTV